MNLNSARNLTIAVTALMLVGTLLVGAASAVNVPVNITIPDIKPEIARIDLVETCNSAGGTANDGRLTSDCNVAAGNGLLTFTAVIFDRNGETANLLGATVPTIKVFKPNADGTASTVAGNLITAGGAGDIQYPGTCTALADYDAGEEDGLAKCTFTVKANQGAASLPGLYTAQIDISPIATGGTDVVKSVQFAVYSVLNYILTTATGADQAVNFGTVNLSPTGTDTAFTSSADYLDLTNNGAATFDVDLTMSALTTAGGTANSIAASKFISKKTCCAAGTPTAPTSAGDAYDGVVGSDADWHHNTGLTPNQRLYFQVGVLDPSAFTNNVLRNGVYTANMVVDIIADTTASPYYHNGSAYTGSAPTTTFQELNDSVGVFTL